MRESVKAACVCLFITLVVQAGMLGFGIARLWEISTTGRTNRGIDIHDAIYKKLTTKYGIRARPCFFEQPVPADEAGFVVVGTMFHSVACDVLVTQKIEASWVEELSPFFTMKAPRWSEGLQRNGPLTHPAHRESETALGWPFRYYFWRAGSSDNMQMGVATEVPLPENQFVVWRLAASIVTTIGLSFCLLRIPMGFRFVRGQFRKRRGLCPGCGYQTSAEQIKCPECGNPVGAAIVTARAKA